MTRDDWLVIGISGVTCGGKTTLASRLAGMLSARVIHQDHYFYPDDHPNHTPVPGLNHNNYDILSALDMDKMYRDTLAVLEGREASGGEAGSGGGAGGAGAAREGGAPAGPEGGASARRVLVLEGFTVLNYRPLYDMCHLRYYLVLQYAECQSRRALRLYSPPDVPGYFERVVWPHHLKYRAQLEHDSRVTFLDGADPDVTSHVVADLRRLGAQPQ